MTTRLAIGLMIVSAIAATACETARDPLALAAEAEINFVGASVGLANPPYGGSYSYDYVYVDSADTSQSDYPYLFPVLGSAFPASLYHSPPYSGVRYMRLVPGAHRFWFSDPHHVVLADTTYTLAASRRTILYLTDSLLHYRVISVDESTPGPTDQMRLRVLQLSPDAGTLNVYASGDTGQLVWSNLPQHLGYTAVTPYVTLDTTVVASDGNVYLNFFAGVDTSQTIVTAIVPFARGRSYHVVVLGNAQQDTLRYATPVIVPPSIRSSVRTTY